MVFREAPARSCLAVILYRVGLQFQTLATASEQLVVTVGLDYAQIGLLIGLCMAPGLFLSLPAVILGRQASDR
jgi:hypothetical protein